ncbi:serine proteinase stubble [Anopheles bellator]|uniref:serine proteinase stubble n=1 Tax=Anopheles bellator TaxID=139047 RepID=UPI002647E659|nr:serine proteinase stubble [Anopheles bellator]
MFAIDCFKSNGTHLGVCIDKIFFGSCCQVNDDRLLFDPDITDNSIDHNSVVNFQHFPPPSVMNTHRKPPLTETRLPTSPRPGNGTKYELVSSSSTTTSRTTPKNANRRTTAAATTKRPLKVQQKDDVQTTTEYQEFTTFQYVQSSKNPAQPRPPSPMTASRRPPGRPTSAASSTTAAAPTTTKPYKHRRPVANKTTSTDPPPTLLPSTTRRVPVVPSSQVTRLPNTTIVSRKPPSSLASTQTTFASRRPTTTPGTTAHSPPTKTDSTTAASFVPLTRPTTNRKRPTGTTLADIPDTTTRAPRPRPRPTSHVATVPATSLDHLIEAHHPSTESGALINRSTYPSTTDRITEGTTPTPTPTPSTQLNPLTSSTVKAPPAPVAFGSPEDLATLARPGLVTWSSILEDATTERPSGNQGPTTSNSWILIQTLTPEEVIVASNLTNQHEPSPSTQAAPPAASVEVSFAQDTKLPIESLLPEAAYVYDTVQEDIATTNQTAATPDELTVHSQVTASLPQLPKTTPPPVSLATTQSSTEAQKPIETTLAATTSPTGPFTSSAAPTLTTASDMAVAASVSEPTSSSSSSSSPSSSSSEESGSSSTTESIGSRETTTPVDELTEGTTETSGEEEEEGSGSEEEASEEGEEEEETGTGSTEGGDETTDTTTATTTPSPTPTVTYVIGSTEEEHKVTNESVTSTPAPTSSPSAVSSTSGVVPTASTLSPVTIANVTSGSTSPSPSTSAEPTTGMPVKFPGQPAANQTSSPSPPTTQTTPSLTTLANITTDGVTLAPDFLTTSTLPSLEGIDYRTVCGKRMFPEPRIVGGTKAAFGRWPWQISLRQWRTSTYLHKCGAALLNENWAITAAHCVDNVPPSDLLLRLGEYDLALEEEPYGYQERRVQIVASHPQFDPRTFEYDLALLRFYEPVGFQPNIIPVCVPENDENFIGRTAFVTGWGRLYEDGPLPSVLQEVTVPVIENKICETMYRSAGYIEHIPHIFICAGWKKGGYDSCEGDSGGPMVIQRPDKRFLLAGVISWGIGCAEPNQPGVYTRISEFRDWINQILQF